MPGRKLARSELAGEEIGSRLVDRIEARRMRNRRGRRDAGLMQPGVDIRRADLAREFAFEVFAVVTEEIRRGDAVEGKMIKIGTQERIEGIAAITRFKEAQEPAALVVGHAGESLIRIDAFEVGDQQLLARLHALHFGMQFLGADHQLHVCFLLAVNRLDNAVLDVAGEAFVEPHVLGVGVGDQIARPGMSKLVGDQADQALVAGNHGWRGESHPRIFHAAKRKARRQDEDVVSLPAIRTVELLGGGDHRLGILELLCRLGDDARLGKHRRARSGRAHVQFADADGQQVGGNRLLHAEAVVAIQRMRNVIVGAHHHAQCLWRGDVRGVGETDRGCVLQRHPAACVDGL